mmetsp:Transcript_49328/g.141839  ORF Transcript_49328/g.141839 Transcript_49328/m.141839 type:complete len:232 (-) Transcript_49328:388-1083(-)
MRYRGLAFGRSIGSACRTFIGNTNRLLIWRPSGCIRQPFKSLGCCINLSRRELSWSFDSRTAKIFILNRSHTFLFFRVVVRGIPTRYKILTSNDYVGCKINNFRRSALSAKFSQNTVLVMRIDEVLVDNHSFQSGNSFLFLRREKFLHHCWIRARLDNLGAAVSRCTNVSSPTSTWRRAKFLWTIFLRRSALMTSLLHSRGDQRRNRIGPRGGPRLVLSRPPYFPLLHSSR